MSQWFWDNCDSSDFSSRDEECLQCEEREERLDSVKHFLEGVLEALYETGNTDNLERCLEEACHIVGIKFVQKEIMFKLGNVA